MENDDLGTIWKALSHPVRREILDLLKERPRPTGELCDAFVTSRFAVMQHIGVLKDAGLVIVRPRGRERWNYLNAVPLQEIYERWLSPYEAHWASSLSRLRAHVEAPEGDSPSMAQETAASEALGSFEIEQEVIINASPERVFESFTKEINTWWAHRLSEGSSTVTLDPQIGGQFRETFDDGGGALWATVTGIKDAEHLTMTGPMGMSGPVVGVMEFRFEARDSGTALLLAHRVVGWIDESTHAGYDEGWRFLFEECLKPLIEKGTTIQSS